MIAALVAGAAVAAAAPGGLDAQAARLFWSRDLGALQRFVAEHPAARETLFGDLLLLCTCQPLPRTDDPVRKLVRAEAARRARLPAAQTIFRDILDPAFFRRDVKNPARALEWPADDEPWPGEVLLVSPLPSGCGPAAGGDELALLDESIDEPRVVYQRAVLLQRRRENYAKAALAIQVERLPPALQRPARLLRAQAFGGYAQLAQEWGGGPGCGPIASRAAHELFKQPREALAISAACAKDPEVATVRTLAAVAAGDSETALSAAAVAPEEAVRPAVLRLAASLPPSPALEALVTRLPVGGLLALAEDALSRGNLAEAAELQKRLAAAHRAREAAVIELEVAAGRGDGRAVKGALEKLYPTPDVRLSERLGRDRAALGALTRIAARDPAPPLRAQLRELAASLQLRVARAAEKDVVRLAELLAPGARVAALGELREEAALYPPAPAPFAPEYPEPASLLVIPDESGAVHAWFDDAALAAGGPP